MNKNKSLLYWDQEMLFYEQTKRLKILLHFRYKQVYIYLYNMCLVMSCASASICVQKLTQEKNCCRPVSCRPILTQQYIILKGLPYFLLTVVVYTVYTVYIVPCIQNRPPPHGYSLCGAHLILFMPDCFAVVFCNVTAQIRVLFTPYYVINHLDLCL